MTVAVGSHGRRRAPNAQFALGIGERPIIEIAQRQVKIQRIAFI